MRTDEAMKVADMHDDLMAEIERLRAALTSIAAYDDIFASDKLREHGTYSSFDEPGAVEIARRALEQNAGESK